MQVTIETYRGIEIWFNRDKETFQCDIDSEKSIKQSYAAVKKYIDDYIKQNNTFKPFKVEGIPDAWRSTEKLTVTGVRKDNRFIAEKEDGSRVQISEYDEKNYMLLNTENKPLWDLLDEISKQEDELRKQRKSVIDRFNKVILKDVKSNYLP